MLRTREQQVKQPIPFEILSQASLHPEQMIEQLPQFSKKIAELGQKLGLETEALLLDHVAMRVNEVTLAEAAHQAWLSYGEVISTAHIAGRPIVVIRLSEPLRVGTWETNYLELPYPAAGKSYPQQGWEHVEFVLPAAATTVAAFEQEVRQRFPVLDEQWLTLEPLGIAMKASAPKAAGERLPNPTLAFRWQDVCIKLHPHALAAVIASEQSA